VNPPKVIAEIGQNHNGRFSAAVESVYEAARCGASGVKFQKRDVAGAEKLYGITHSNPEQAYGNNYGWHRSNLELEIEYHARLKDIAHGLSMIYGCSVFDMQSAKEVISIKPDYIKVGSGCNLNYKLIRHIMKESDLPIHISMGATSKQEIKQIKDILKDEHAGREVVIYHCVSAYPTNAKNLCLMELLSGEYNGFSNHSLNTTSDIIAFAYGARWIERHFTFSRKQKGSDHAVSLEPAEFKGLVKSLRDIAPALTYKDGILECEDFVREQKLDGMYSYDVEDE
jgi:sialic acid synthase